MRSEISAGKNRRNPATIAFSDMVARIFAHDGEHACRRRAFNA